MIKRMSHPKYKSLVELLHGALQLASLVLPLFIIAHCLHSGALPCGGTCHVINKVDPPHLVNTTLPAEGVKLGGGGRINALMTEKPYTFSRLQDMTNISLDEVNNKNITSIYYYNSPITLEMTF